MTMDETWQRAENCAGGAACVEVAWRKAAASKATGNCVEAAWADHEVWVRDSKLGESSPILKFTLDEWEAFLEGAALGTFNVDQLMAGEAAQDE